MRFASLPLVGSFISGSVGNFYGGELSEAIDRFVTSGCRKTPR
jgi:hypothetical protein